jgi:hypothetical protein
VLFYGEFGSLEEKPSTVNIYEQEMKKSIKKRKKKLKFKKFILQEIEDNNNIDAVSIIDKIKSKENQKILRILWCLEQMVTVSLKITSPMNVDEKRIVFEKVLGIKYANSNGALVLFRFWIKFYSLFLSLSSTSSVIYRSLINFLPYLNISTLKSLKLIFFQSYSETSLLLKFALDGLYYVSAILGFLFSYNVLPEPGLYFFFLNNLF